MKTQNNLKQKILSNSVVFGLIGVIILISVLNSHDVKGTISAACRKSPECMAAVDDEKAANAAAVTATSNANFYQAKVADLNTDIAAMRRKIADTKAQIVITSQSSVPTRTIFTTSS